MHTQTRGAIVRVVVLVLVLLMAVPVQRAAALITITQILTQTSTDFSSGTFGLTGLTQDGGVQLVPVGVLKNWQPQGGSLCRPVGDMGTATFKEYIYVVGGLTSSSGSPSILPEVCRTKVLSALGNTETWATTPSENLPAGRFSLASVAVPMPGDPTRGVLYAIGGASTLTVGAKQTIYSAIINPDGSLQPWTTQTLALPEQREKLMATTYTNDDGKTFIYVLGGYAQPFINTYAYSEVLRTEVGANGTLAPWVTGANNGVGPIPIPTNSITGAGACADEIGLYDGDVVNFDVITDSPTEGPKRIMAVLGGIFELGTGDAVGACTSGVAPSAKTFLAEIDSDGSLSWQTTDYSMLFPNKQLRAIGINQKIYAVGGVVSNEVTNKSYSTYVDNTLSLKNFVSSNYLENDSALPAALRRASHGFEIVVINDTTKTPPVPRPIAYLFGGTNSGGTTYRSDVLSSLIGLDDDISDTNAAYASPGNYISPVYPMRGIGNITEVSWSASITHTGSLNNDVKMEYRVANTTLELKTTAWKPVDGDLGSTYFSVNGSNVGIASDTGTGAFVQYKASLSTDQSSNRLSTPVLRGTISVKYTVEGHPSLHVKSGSFPTITSGATVIPSIVIANATPPLSSSTESVLDADIESGGFLFVDLYVYPPGALVVPPTPDANGIYPLTSAAFAEVNKNTLPRTAERSIPGSSWKQNCGPTSACPAANWQVIFNKPGLWTVIAVVDSGNNVQEADSVTDEWETDNTFTFTVDSQVQGGNMYLPLIFTVPPPAR